MQQIKVSGDYIIMGKNSIEYMNRIKNKKVFIITGGQSMYKNGTIDKIEKMLSQNKCEYEIFSGIKQNPTTSDVLLGLSKMKIFLPDIVVAVGGGSSIDCAKVMTLFYEYHECNFENIRMMKEWPEKRSKVQLIAVPSTSGTSTEFTNAAVITYEKEKFKVGLKGDCLIPDIAILDPCITLSMPKNIVAQTGMDAMTHAVESYINKNRHDLAECLMKGGISGLYKYLPLSYEEGTLEYREKVHNSVAMIGLTLTTVGVGMAHGIAHAIGGIFDVPHGILCAIALPFVLKYNSQDSEVANRLSELARHIGTNDFIDAIRSLNKQLDIPSSFHEAGIAIEEYEKNLNTLVDNSLEGPTKVNPVEIDREKMKDMLQVIYKGDKSFLI